MRAPLLVVLSAVFILSALHCAGAGPQPVVDPFYYDLLGVDPGAHAIELRKGYRYQAVLFHPDKHPNDKGAELRFQVVSFEVYRKVRNAR